MAKVKMNTEEEIKEVVLENKKANKTKEIKKVIVANCDLLRLRESASTESKVLDVIKKGTELELLNTVDESWSRVRTSSGKIGFVMSNYISKEY